ncbi:MAG: cellulase family glycosylhydrolase [Betaproteobacteria bacterium]|nr:cellulase family glycosylhydrolase [Betaproteobacteria bacterium]
MKSKLVVVNWLFFLTAVIHFAAVADAAYAAKEHPASAGGYAILLNTEGEGTEWVGTDEMRVAQVSTPSERRQAVDEGYFSVQRKGLTVGGWGDRISRDDIQALAQTGATLTRVFIRTKNCDKCTQFNLVPSELPKVDLVLQEASKLGVRVVIALQLSTKRYWDDPMLQKSVSLIWADVARRYKGNESIVGFDLINEPNPPRSA